MYLHGIGGGSKKCIGKNCIDGKICFDGKIYSDCLIVLEGTGRTGGL